MRILVTMRRQKAVYWPPKGRNRHGEFEWYSPVELDVRWEDGGEEKINFDGKEIIPEHVVYVGEDLELGGLLFNGSEMDLKNPEPPSTDVAHRIKKFEKIPTLNAKRFLRMAYL